MSDSLNNESEKPVSLKWHHIKNDKEQGWKIHESLYIDEIIIPEKISKDKKINSYVLDPQNIINIILRRKDSEIISMSSTEFGFLFPKIEKYRKGLWIIEPGFVHPNYNGPISVHVCNLSKVPLLINVGDPLVEIVVFSSQRKNEILHKKNHDAEEYRRDRRSEAIMFPRTFLDVEENTNKIKDQVGMEPFRNMLLVVLSMFAIIVGSAGWVNWKIGKDVRDAIVDTKNLEDIDVKKEIQEYVRQELKRQQNEKKP